MIPVCVEGVRRNFIASSAFLYSVFLLDDTGQRFLTFGLERHEALPIVASLNRWTLPRPEAINVMAETLKTLGCALEEVCIESHSMLPPVYNLCNCRLRWRNGETVQEQTRSMRPGDVIGLALLMDVPILLADELSEKMSRLAEGQPLEAALARYMLSREGITLPAGREPRLGYSKTPLRDALVKEFKASLAGKAPVFPEEDMEKRKQEYLAYIGNE